jgi:hypothetical protein
MKTENETWAIYRMSDCDWWLARSPEEAIEDFVNHTGEPDDFGAETLTTGEMNKLQFWDTEDQNELNFEHWKCECGAMADANCRWDGYAYEHCHGYPIMHVQMTNIHRRSFAEELARRVERGVTSPEMFATTEF